MPFGAMWPFNQRERAASAPEPVDESLESRVTTLEQRMGTIEFEWESVVSKLRQKVARDASRARRDLEQQLEEGNDQGDDAIVAQGGSQIAPQPGTQEHRALMKAQLRRQAAQLRNGRTG